VACMSAFKYVCCVFACCCCGAAGSMAPVMP
jgi:hypothetical protein